MNLRIETLRGLACILLVLYHVVGADAHFGLRIADGPVRLINDGLVYLRMPLFIFLSGVVYGLRPFGGNTRAFLTGKARRLLLPMLVVGTLFAVAQSLTPNTHSSVGPWYLLHIQPVAHYWFVESAFWVFVVVWALERWNLIRKPGGFLVTLGLSCAVYLTVRGWHWLGIDGAIYLMPYFLLGLAFARFPIARWLAGPTGKLALVAVAVGAILLMGPPVSNPDRRTVGILVAGIALCALCFSVGVAIPRLAAIGRHSYAVYLFHVFFTAATRTALVQLQIDSLALHLLLGMTLGLAGPMLLSSVVSRFKWPALLLLGKTVKDDAIAAPRMNQLAAVR